VSNIKSASTIDGYKERLQIPTKVTMSDAHFPFEYYSQGSPNEQPQISEDYTGWSSFQTPSLSGNITSTLRGALGESTGQFYNLPRSEQMTRETMESSFDHGTDGMGTNVSTTHPVQFKSSSCFLTGRYRGYIPRRRLLGTKTKPFPVLL
jgi:hypothetical protein